METGLDIQATKEKLRKFARDPVRLKWMTTGVLLFGGLFVLCRPQVQRIEAARGKLSEIEERAEVAKKARGLAEQQRNYASHIWGVADVGDWQNYVMQKLEQTPAKLRRLMPRRIGKKSKFRIIELDLTATGRTEDLVELIDLLERGERLVRITHLNLEKGRDSPLVLTCVVVGLAEEKRRPVKKGKKEL